MGVDILSPEGFLQNLLQVCRSKPGGMYLADPVCSTFVFMNLDENCVVNSFSFQNKNLTSSFVNTMSQQAFTEGIHKTNLILRARFPSLCPLYAATNTRQDDQQHAQNSDQLRQPGQHKSEKANASQKTKENELAYKLGDKLREAHTAVQTRRTH